MADDTTRQRLLEAAGQVFAAKGFEAGTVREICERAEANVAAVNYYFGDKQRLYIDAVREAKCVRDEEVPLPAWPAELSAEDRLREFIRIMLLRTLGDRAEWHLELMLRELARPTAACREVVEDYIRPMAEELQRILRDLLPPDTSPDELWLVGFSIVGQCLFYYVQRPIVEQLVGPDHYRGLTTDLLADHIANFTLAALVARASTADAAARQAVAPPDPRSPS